MGWYSPSTLKCILFCAHFCWFIHFYVFFVLPMYIDQFAVVHALYRQFLLISYIHSTLCGYMPFRWGMFSAIQAGHTFCLPVVHQIHQIQLGGCSPSSDLAHGNQYISTTWYECYAFQEDFKIVQLFHQRPQTGGGFPEMMAASMFPVSILSQSHWIQWICWNICHHRRSSPWSIMTHAGWQWLWTSTAYSASVVVVLFAAFTLPKTSSLQTEHWWLEDDPLWFGKASWQVLSVFWGVYAIN